MGSSSPLCLPSVFTSSPSPSPSLPHALMMAHSHSHHRIPLAPSSLSATSSTADDHDILDDVFADQPNEPHPLHDSNGLSHSHSHSHSHSSGNEEDPNSLDDVFDLSPLPEDEDDANLIHHRHHSHTNGVDILETFGDHYEHDQETHHEHEHEHSSVSSHSSASSSSSHSSSSPHSHVHDDHLSHGDGFTLENNIFDHELEIHTSPVYSSSSSSSSSSSASSSASSSIYSPSYSAPSSPLHGNGLHHASEDLPPSFGITLPSPSKTETYVTKNRMENCALIPDYLEDDSERQKLLQSYDDFHKEEVTLWDPATAKKKEQPDTTHDASLLLCFKLLQRLFGRTVSFEKVLYLYSANGYNFESAIRSCFPNLRLLDSEKTSLPCPRDILFNIRDWSELEKDLFETGLENFGKNWRLMHRLIKSRTRAEMLPYYYYWKGTSRFERFMEVRRQAEMDNNSARSHNWRFLVKLKRGLFGLPPISKCRVIAEPFSLPAPADNLVTEEEILLPRRVILGDGHDFDPSTDLDHRLPSSSTSSHPPRSRRPPPPSPPSSSAVVVSSEEVEPSRQFEVDSSMNVMEGEQEPLFDLQGADVRPSGRESSYLFDPQQSPLLADEDEAAEEFDVVEDDGDSSFEDPLRPRSFLHHDRPSSASSQPPRKRHRDA